LQDPNNACPTKEARANDLACLIKEAKALDVKGINSENTIIVETPIKGSNPIRGSKSRIIRIDLTSRIDFTNRENWIKARKANRAKLRD